MEYLNFDASALGAEDAEDIEIPTEQLEGQLAHLREKLAQVPIHETLQRAHLLLEVAGLQLRLERRRETWQTAREAFDVFAEMEEWESAVQACNLLFASEQFNALVALGNGVWLAVTFPINPELSVVMLEHIVNETPDDSDGGAIAAAVAHYLVDLRAQPPERENLIFFTNQLLAKVARRHSKVENQSEFEAWVDKLELHSPEKFLPRLAQILNVMVQDDWWVDREILRAKLP